MAIYALLPCIRTLRILYLRKAATLTRAIIHHFGRSGKSDGAGLLGSHAGRELVDNAEYV
jgi:hypothetical protein